MKTNAEIRKEVENLEAILPLLTGGCFEIAAQEYLFVLRWVLGDDY